jgi:hypothetical protein
MRKTIISEANKINNYLSYKIGGMSTRVTEMFRLLYSTHDLSDDTKYEELLKLQRNCNKNVLDTLEHLFEYIKEEFTNWENSIEQVAKHASLIIDLNTKEKYFIDNKEKELLVKYEYEGFHIDKPFHDLTIHDISVLDDNDLLIYLKEKVSECDMDLFYNREYNTKVLEIIELITDYQEN